jgi:SAM-dependent methyltransferase
MSALPNAALTSFYRALWPENGSSDRRSALFERNLGGRPIDEVLYELAGKSGINSESVVLDVGCGKGRHACAIARRFSCLVLAMDPLDHCLSLAGETARQEGVAELVEFRRGDMHMLPVADRSVDLVCCVDVFNHAENPSATLLEFARVLKPGGVVFNCSALATPALESGEQEWLCRTLSLNPDTLFPGNFEQILASSGLRVQVEGSTTETGSKFLEPVGEDDYRYVKRLAHMARDERHLVEVLGEEDYQMLKAHALWNTYLLIGKITYHVWVMGLRP